MQHASVHGKPGSFATVKNIFSFFNENWKFTSVFTRGWTGLY